MTISTDFKQLEQLFARLDSRQGASKILRDSIRSNERLRRISRSSALGRAGVNSASMLGSVLVEQLLSHALAGANGAGHAGLPQYSPFSGGINTASGLGDIVSQTSVQQGLAGIFSNLFEGLFEDAFTRTRTRSNSTESQRSQETSTRWNTSRSQADAELASIVNRGLGQL